jgi:hypothetical protein
MTKAHGGASMAQSIPLTQGKFTLVDDEDFEKLNKFKWYFHDGYAIRQVKGKIVRMHREIANTPIDMLTDHINGDKLDNRKVNLRPCTTAQNVQNRSNQSNNSSGFKGVSWSKKNNKWSAMININKKRTHLGYFKTAEEAAKVYDLAAIENYGEFANLNFS